MDNSGIVVLLFLALGFIWLLPLFMIMGSNKTTRGEKLAWILAMLFISWFAWIFYMLLAPIKKKS